MGPILEILNKKFSNGEKNLENFISYGKISKIITEKLTKKYGIQEKILNFSYKCINKMKHFMILIYVMNLNEHFFVFEIKMK